MKKVTTIRLPEELLEILTELAKKEHRPLSSLIRMLIIEALQRRN